MKKIYCALLILCALLCVACSRNTNEPDRPAAAEAPAEATPTPTPTQVPATREPISVEVEAEHTPEADPTEEPVPAPTPEPAEAAEAEPTEAAVPQPTEAPVTDEMLDAGYLDGWFDDAVLVGDSLVGGLSGYVLQERNEGRTCLGHLQLVPASALTLKKALECEQKARGSELKCKGRYMTISEVVTTLEAKRLFIMLGVSDPRWFTPEEMVDTYDQLITLIKAQHPDLEIIIHSIMPMVKDYAGQVNMTYEINKTVNEHMRAYCAEKGITYIELADLVRDEDGFLKYEYSASDYRFHLGKEGKRIWVHCLREYARDAYYAGKWSLEEN